MVGQGKRPGEGVGPSLFLMKDTFLMTAPAKLFFWVHTLTPFIHGTLNLFAMF